MSSISVGGSFSTGDGNRSVPILLLQGHHCLFVDGEDERSVRFGSHTACPLTSAGECRQRLIPNGSSRVQAEPAEDSGRNGESPDAFKTR